MHMANVIKNLNRVHGQVGAIKVMVEQHRDCYEIVTQIAAARSALASIARDLLTEQACICSTSEDKRDELNKALKSLFSVS